MTLQKNKNIIILTFAILFFFASLYIIYILIYKKDSNNLCDIRATVTEVYDGDTVQAGGYKIRLIGTDAPENLYEDSEIKDHKFYGCPEFANKLAEEKLLGKKITFCQDRSGQEEDIYGRKLRYAMIDENVSTNVSSSVNEEIFAIYGSESKPFSYYAIKNGYSKRYAYATYIREDVFKKLEKEAKENKIGIWSEKCQQQDLNIKKENNQCGQLEETELCTIKGNVSSAGKYYYNIGDNNYKQVKINVSKGERWFCTEKEAIKCGWTHK